MSRPRISTNRKTLRTRVAYDRKLSDVAKPTYVQRQLLIRADQYELLAELAGRENRSIAAVLRDVIAAGLKERTT